MEGIRLREWKAGFRLRSQAVGMRGSEVEAKRERNRAVGMMGMMVPVWAWREL